MAHRGPGTLDSKIITAHGDSSFFVPSEASARWVGRLTSYSWSMRTLYELDFADDPCTRHAAIPACHEEAFVSVPPVLPAHPERQARHACKQYECTVNTGDILLRLTHSFPRRRVAQAITPGGDMPRHAAAAAAAA